MSPQEFKEKLSEILSSLDEIAQAGEEVRAQMQAEDRFTAEREIDAVRCNCGLIMSVSNFYEHWKETGHETSAVEPYLYEHMPEATNLKKDQKRVRPSGLPSGKRKQRPKMVKSAPESPEPVLHFSFSNSQGYDEL